jgi:iron uptake system component EfeO
MMKKLSGSVLAVSAASATAALLLGGCASQDSSDSGIAVSATDDSCAVETSETTSGTTTFTVTNDGQNVTEFYVLGEDGLRIVSEQENIAPGATAQLTVSLQPGDYFTACKPGLRGAHVGAAAFTVTGDPVEVVSQDEELYTAAVDSYVDFVKNEVAELVPKVEDLAQSYVEGDDAAAREAFAPTRVHYERIEPIAEALGTLDPRIDYREVDYLAEAQDLAADDPGITEWTGFHRIEKDLWPPSAGDLNADGSPATEHWRPSTPEDRQRIGRQLVADVQGLYGRVHDADFAADQQMNISSVSNGAMGLLEEVAVSKVTGEEDWWSHTDLSDFQGNVEGSRIAFDLVAPIAERKGEEGARLVADINAQYDALAGLLAEYGSLEEGFVPYDQVSAGQRAELTRQIDELREPLSRLTGTVLQIQQ